MIRAKVRAAQSRTSLKSLFETALRELLDVEPARTKRFTFPTGELNVPPNLDLSSNAAVLEYVESLE